MDPVLADVGPKLMRAAKAWVVAGLAALVLCGCTGETTAADQASKRAALDKVASQSPNADKIEH